MLKIIVFSSLFLMPLLSLAAPSLDDTEEYIEENVRFSSIKAKYKSEHIIKVNQRKPHFINIARSWRMNSVHHRWNSPSESVTKFSCDEILELKSNNSSLWIKIKNKRYDLTLDSISGGDRAQKAFEHFCNLMGAPIKGDPFK